MDGPEVLVSHYASLAFYTRIAALTFVGAIVGTMEEQLDNPEVRPLIGVGVLLVVAALAEFNRRYIQAYVASVNAASHVDANANEDMKASAGRWQIFRKLNGLDSDSLRSRMLLSWLTYLPGGALGVYLLVTTPDHMVLGILLGVVLIAWMIWVAWRPYVRKR